MIKSQCWVNKGSIYFGIGYLISDIISRRRHCIQFVYTVWFGPTIPPLFFLQKNTQSLYSFDICVWSIFVSLQSLWIHSMSVVWRTDGTVVKNTIFSPFNGSKYSTFLKCKRYDLKIILKRAYQNYYLKWLSKIHFISQ